MSFTFVYDRLRRNLSSKQLHHAPRVDLVPFIFVVNQIRTPEFIVIRNKTEFLGSLNVILIS